MATPVKKDYHTHAEGYRDLDGNHRQFTFIDHDPKTKIATGKKENMEELKQASADYREYLITSILETPASLCPELFWDYTHRGNVQAITWNETMLRDSGISVDRLRDMKVLIEKFASQFAR